MTRPPSPDDDIQAQAVLWAVRINDPEFINWARFEVWLSSDPAHAAAYHRAVEAEETIVAMLAQAPSAAAVPATTMPVRPADRRSWRRSAPWVGGALAASLVLVATFGVWRPASDGAIYQTGPGEHRDIILADGSQIALNGSSRLVATARTIRLEQGEALFTVRHDPTRPFLVTVGDATITDVGTVFDVVREPSATRVAVAQGTVLWNPARDAVRLEAGRGLRAQDRGSTVELAAIDPSAVGGWSTGQLSYEGVPLSSVAGDIARSLGVAVSVSPDVADRPVRGILRLKGGAEAVLPRLAALLGLHAHHDGTAWRLTASP